MGAPVSLGSAYILSTSPDMITVGDNRLFWRGRTAWHSHFISYIQAGQVGSELTSAI